MNRLIILTIISFVIISCNIGNSKLDEAEKLSNELDSIENLIIIGIENKDSKQNLLELASKLKHPSDLIISRKLYGIIPNHNGSANDNYYGTFMNYYDDLSNSYKQIIIRDLSINQWIVLNQKKTIKNSKNQPKEVDTSSLFLDRKTNSDLVQPKVKVADIVKYAGVYSKEGKDGVSYVYKIFELDGKIEIIYQDNSSGSLTASKFVLKQFDQNQKKLVLTNLDNKATKNISFKESVNSANGFELVDMDGTIYEFITK